MRAVLLEVALRSRLASILLIDLPRHETLLRVIEELHSAGLSRLTNADAIIVRLPVEINSPVAAHSVDLEPVKNRAPNIPIYVLGSYNFEHQVTDNQNPNSHDGWIWVEGETRQSFLKSLRESELHEMALSGHAILPPHEGHWYHLPSGAYSKTFIRVGNIQRSVHSLDACFFWMLPYLQNCAAILTDTWSISSIALNAARRLTAYDPAGGKRDIEMFSQYLGTSMDDAEISDILRRTLIPDGFRAVVVISAQMTGLLEQKVRKVIEDYAHRENRFDFITLYRLSERVEGDSLCDLSEGFQGFSFERQDTLPPEHQTAPVIIDPATYFPRTLTEIKVLFRQDTANTFKDVIDEYRNANVFQVHRDVEEAGQTKHRGVYMDVSSMLKIQRFRKRFEDAIADLPQMPKVIISPPHNTGDALRQIARDVLAAKHGQTAASFAHPSLLLKPDTFHVDKQISDLLKSLSSNDAILLLDDTCNSGDRISRYQKNLRDYPPALIQCVVGVAKTDDEVKWDKVVSDLQFRDDKRKNVVKCVEQIVLPNWGIQTCPWCSEKHLLEDYYVKHNGLPAELESRLIQLTDSSSTGLTNNLFLELGDEAPIKLTPGSLFAGVPCSQADIFTAVASVLQQFRTVRRKRLLQPHTYTLAPVLESEEYLFKTFNDSILRASILRAAYPYELIHIDRLAEIQRSDRASGIVSSPDDNTFNLTPELGLAHAAKKVTLHDGVLQLCKPKFRALMQIFLS